MKKLKIHSKLTININNNSQNDLWKYIVKGNKKDDDKLEN